MTKAEILIRIRDWHDESLALRVKMETCLPEDKRHYEAAFRRANAEFESALGDMAYAIK